MGLLKRLPLQDEPHFDETRHVKPAEGKWDKSVDLDDDSDPLSAARGAVLGVFLGGIIWAVLLWAIL